MSTNIIRNPDALPEWAYPLAAEVCRKVWVAELQTFSANCLKYSERAQDCMGKSLHNGFADYTPKGLLLTLYDGTANPPAVEFTWQRFVDACKDVGIGPEERPISSAQCSDAATAAESQTAASPAVPEASSHTTETAPAVPSAATPASADEESAAQSAISGNSLDKPLTVLPDNMRPTFDYSGLTEQTVADLHLAENEYLHGKKLAERGLVHMGDAIAIAHDALCGTVVAQCDNGRFAKKEDTFRAWCLSIGITKDSAYRLLQVSALMDGSNPRQRKILESLPPTLLYAAAKPSAPQELVEKVKNGEVSSNKEYQALLKENQQLRTDRVNAMNQAEREKARADTAEAHLSAANADITGLTQQNAQLKEQVNAAEAREEEAWQMQSKAEARAKNAESQLAGSRQVAEAAKIRADKYKAENDALKRQPIEAVVVDKDEEERQINQRAHDIAEDLAVEMTSDYKAQQEQDARDAYDSILLAGRSITNTAQSIKPLFRKLPEQQREAAINMFVSTLGQIQGEVSKCL